MVNSSIKENALIYTRVSTKDQVDGASLETQERECRNCVEQRLNARTLKVFVEEGESAKTTNRTQLKALFQFITENNGAVKYLVVYDVSRISRDVGDFASIQIMLGKNGVNLISVMEPSIDKTPTGKLTGNLFASFAQYENDLRAAKVQDSMRERARQGYWVTQAPVGFIVKTVMPDGGLADSIRGTRRKYPKILVPDTRNDLARNIAEVMTRFSAGEMTETQAYQMALGLGITGVHGKPLTFSRFEKMMRSPVYGGYSNSRKLLDGEMVKLKFDGLVSFEVWERNQILLNKDKRTLVAKDNSLYPLDGTILCPHCGMPLHGDAPRDGSGNCTPRYYCRGGSKRGHGYQSATAKEIHALFDSLLQRLTPKEGTVRLFREVLKRTAYRKLTDSTSELARLDEQMASIQEKKNRALESLLDGELTVEEKDSLILSLDARRQDLEAHRVELEQQQTLNEATIEYVMNFINKPAKLWRDADLDSKRAFQQMLFPNGLHVDLKAKECRTADLGPLYSVMNIKNGLESPEDGNMVISRRVELLLTG